MTRIAKTLLFAFLCGALCIACGDDDDDTVADGGPDSSVADAAPDSGGGGGACGEFDSPATTLSTYPATYDGDLAGAGATLTVGPGVCTDERGYYPPLGEDQVIRLTGLTAGSFYRVVVASEADTSFYVATDCTETSPTSGGPAEGQCLFFNDISSGGESGAFTGPTGGEAFLVVDNFNTTTPGVATYTVDITEVDCIDSFDCAGETPVCDATGTCIAPPADCVGDDDGEPDDGPTEARPVTFGETTSGSICNSPLVERDWYSFTAAGGTGLSLALSWATTADLDMEVYDSTGALLYNVNSVANPETLIVPDLPAGDYLISVLRFGSTPDTAVTPYTLGLAIPECTDFYDCTSEEPVCDTAGLCITGFDSCTGDDANDTGSSDDGPLGATDVTPAPGATTTTNAAVCSDPFSEVDFFAVTVADGEGIDATLTFTGADLDLYIADATGRTLGQSFWVSPERVVVTYLPAGTYHILVRMFSDAPVTEATAYSLAVTRTAAQVCTSSADCAAEYATQIYRGDCTGGVCQDLAGAGAVADGDPCDTNDDCTSGFCAYIVFESDADKAVCSTECTTDTDCDAVGPGLACTTSLQTNFCLPDCTSNLECGVFQAGSADLDPDQPWDYAICDVTAGSCGL
jgi:pre-peptidase